MIINKENNTSPDAGGYLEDKVLKIILIYLYIKK